jgi:type II secretion system protein G
MYKKSIKGFTLIELLIVVAIIGILAAIAIPNFLNAQVRSKVARTKADMRTIATGLETYAVDNNDYIIPYPRAEVGSMTGNPQTWPLWEHYTDGMNQGCGEWLTTPISYLSSIPFDPFNTSMRDGIGVPADVSVYYDNWPGAGNSMNYNTHCGEPGVYENVKYCLWSVGPNLTSFNCSSGDRSRVYDPTNGTISQGDLLLLSSTGLLNK